MTSRWHRATTCDRCGKTDVTEHFCGGREDWPKGWRQLHDDKNKPIDLCPECWATWHAFMNQGVTER